MMNLTEPCDFQLQTSEGPFMIWPLACRRAILLAGSLLNIAT